MTLAAATFETVPDSMGAAQDAAQVWDGVCRNLALTLGEGTFASWLKPLSLVESAGGHVTLAAPTRFLKEWVTTHYLDEITRQWRAMDDTTYAIELVVRANTAPAANGPQMVVPPPAPVAPAPTENFMAHLGKTAAFTGDDDLQVSAPLDPRYTFDNFIVGKSNELAYAAARRVAESAQVLPGCNPLFLYGGVGLGKTHLMHAIAWGIRKTNPERRVIYLSAEKFMYQFIRALRSKEALAFKDQFRSVDVLMVDDVQFISGKDSTQEEFFHTFNTLVDQNKQLIISCDRSPSDLEGFEERVKSRLGWGLVADVHATDFELRLGILQAKAEHMPGMNIPKEVLEFLAVRVTSNIRELEGALNRVVAHASLVGRPVSLEGTQELLADLLRANDRRVSVEDIQKQVAAHFNIRVSDMHSGRRSRAVARPRQVAMYLAKKLTTKSLPDIGRKFGGKDHTTVMHAVKRVEELMQTDAEFAEDVSRIHRAVNG